MQAGEWWQSLDHDEPCRIVSAEVLWNQPVAMVWLPRRNTVARVPQERLAPLPGLDEHALDRVSYVSSAARILEALANHELIAQPEGSVIPLPHQLYAVQRALSGDRVRYLLADEVGLGKTIEAGLILRELKSRGLVRRALVVAPAGLVPQWVSELKVHFNEDFRAVAPAKLSAMRDAAGIDDGENLWRLHDQVVCPLDSVKPLDARRGWSHEQIARTNRDRFDDLVAAGWDLVIIDEAHRLGGSSEQVARFRLGEGLSEAAPYLLLLSATPHQGKSDSFRRLIGFLDPDAVPAEDAISREIVSPYVIRTEKRRAIDAKGDALFQPRKTQLLRIPWMDARPEQHALYEAVTSYVRDGYNRAMREKQTAVGFLMILMQRLVTSSTAAIRTALTRRLEILGLPEGQLSLFPEDIAREWAELEGQEQLETVLAASLKGLHDERSEVELLLSAARRCETLGPDVKAAALLNLILRLQREENEPALKVLVFTEFVPTQAMLSDFLGQRGFSVVTLNGSMSLSERQEAQRGFAGEAQIMISTDAGGEGLNLQFCHVVVNYDLPWNPMKLEQRIGRVDRIGQKHPVRAFNFALEDTVELRVREVLEEKLQRILTEFGVDKLADVLDSEESGASFEELFARAVIAPEDAERRAADLANEIRRKAESARDGAALLSPVQQIDPSAATRLAEHPMPFWIERMTVAYLSAEEGAGAAIRDAGVGFDLRWPDGHAVRNAVFSRHEAEASGAYLLTLEDEHVRRLTTALPVFVPDRAPLAVVVPGISDKVTGCWSLWRIALHADGEVYERYLPLFVSHDDRVLAPTARAVWDRLIVRDGIRVVPGRSEEGVASYESARGAAEAQGALVFDELRAAHRERLARERKKLDYATLSRRRAIERVGIPNIRARRLAQLDAEYRQELARLEAREDTVPELTAILLVRIAREGS